MLLIFISIIIITSFFITYGYYNQVSLLEQKESEKLKYLATSIALCINGDDHVSLMNSNQVIWKDKNYIKIHEILEKNHSKNNVQSAIYTLVLNEDDQKFYYGVRSDSFVDFKNQYVKFPPILLTNYKTGGIIPRYKTENGEYLSAFHPILNSKGQTVAVVETDIDFSQFKSQAFNHYFTESMLSLLVILIIAFILLKFSIKILRYEEKDKNRLEIKRKTIEKKNRDINDSINYALQIQEAHLPALKHIQETLPNTFIFYKPKDTIGGDFFWYKNLKNTSLIAAVDCTGHGVPGALMSMLGHAKLDATINQHKNLDPGEILDKLDKSVTATLDPNEHSKQSNDGMDIALCSFDLENKTLKFAGALRPLVIINGDNYTEIKGDKFPIGGGQIYTKTNFKTHSLPIQKNDCFYIFSDGYADQFGGPNRKKFMKKRLKKLLISIQYLPAEEQKQIIKDTLTNWQGNYQQIDDILIIGICF